MSAPESTSSNAFIQSWNNRRTHQNIWTRTDSARWLDERAPAGLAWLNAFEPPPTPNQPRRVRNFGTWLLANRVHVFNHAHAILNATPTAARDSASITDVLPKLTKNQRQRSPSRP